MTVTKENIFKRLADAFKNATDKFLKRPGIEPNREVKGEPKVEIVLDPYPVTDVKKHIAELKVGNKAGANVPFDAI